MSVEMSAEMSAKPLKHISHKVIKSNGIEEEMEITSNNNNIEINESKKKCKQTLDSNSNKKFCNNVSENNGINGMTDISTNVTTNANLIDLSLNYTPKLFLRSHCKQNDPFDNTTAIWSASFQPKTTTSDGNRFVATCGANMVCIIDCDKTMDSSGKSVIARYIDDDKDEELVSLAWNVETCNSGGDCGQYNTQTTILAVGGKRNILLLSTNEFHCYERLTDAHSDQINALIFNEKGQLLSASYDKKIKIWNISSPNDQNVTKMWKCVDTNNEMLSLCFSFKYNTLIASGIKGITFWCNAFDDNSDGVLGQIKTTRLVDGLHTIPEDEDSIAIRIYDSKLITIIDLKKAMNEMTNSTNNSKIKSILLKRVQKAKLESFDLGFPYIYLSAQKNLLVSGGPKGQIFLYNTNKFSDYYKNKVIGKPDRIIEWPPIENILKDDKMVIDDQKFVIVNTIALSADLKYIIACTNINLICIWHQKISQ